MDAKKESPIIVEMEKELLNDKSGSYKRNLLNKLNGFEGDMNRLINSGVSSETFEVYNKVKEAIKQAIVVISNFK